MLNCLSIHFNPAINICNLFERKMDFTYMRVYNKYAAAFAFVFQYILGSMLLDYWRMNKTPKIDFHNFQYFFFEIKFLFHQLSMHTHNNKEMGEKTFSALLSHAVNSNMFVYNMCTCMHYIGKYVEEKKKNIKTSNVCQCLTYNTCGGIREKEIPAFGYFFYWWKFPFLVCYFLCTEFEWNMIKLIR